MEEKERNCNVGLVQSCIQELKLDAAVTSHVTGNLIYSAVPNSYLINICTRHTLTDVSSFTKELCDGDVYQLATKSYCGKQPPENCSPIFIACLKKFSDTNYRRVPTEANPFEKDSLGYHEYQARVAEQNLLNSWLRNNKKSPLTSTTLRANSKLATKETYDGAAHDYSYHSDSLTGNAQNNAEEEMRHLIGKLYDKEVIALVDGTTVRTGSSADGAAETDPDQSFSSSKSNNSDSIDQVHKSVTHHRNNCNLSQPNELPIASAAHSNLLPAFACLETRLHFYVLLDYSDFTLKDILDYSPALVESTEQKCFLFYQILAVAKFIQSVGLSVGLMRTEHFFIDNNTWIQVVPDFQSCFDNIFQRLPESSSTGESKAEEPLIPLNDATRAWVCGDLSNFDYLMILNHAAGRRMNEPSNHPILPWVTDFKYPVARRSLKNSKYRLNKGDAQLDFSFTSTKSIKCHFETAPNSEMDPWSITAPHHVTHYFSDITYYVYKARVTPVKVLCKHVRPNWVPQEYPPSMERLYEWSPDEAIPEFFTDSSIFKSMHPDMADMKLPTWCNGDPELFIKMHREILESDEVSEKLHHWIDITFGYQLSGSAAVNSKNVVLQLVDNHKHPMSSGPLQLFNVPHPPKLIPVNIDLSGIPELDTLLQTSCSVPMDENEVQALSMRRKHRSKRTPKLDFITPLYVAEALGLFTNKLNPLQTSGTTKLWKNPSSTVANAVPFRLWSDVIVEDLRTLTFLWCHLWLSKRLYFQNDQTIDHTLSTCSKFIEQRYSMLSRCFTVNFEILMQDRTNDVKVTPALLLQPHCHVIRMPTGMDMLYKICQYCSVLLSASEIDTYCRDILISLQKMISVLDASSQRHIYNLCLPFIQTLFENEITRTASVTHLLTVVCRPLPIFKSCEMFLKAVEKCYEVERDSSDLSNLYTPEFAQALMNIFGMDQFLRKLLRFFVEAMAGSKDVGSDSEHADAVDDICHDLMIVTSPRESCDKSVNEAQISLAESVDSSDAVPSSEIYCTASSGLEASVDSSSQNPPNARGQPMSIPGKETKERKESLGVSEIIGKGPWNLFAPPSPATSCGMNEYSELVRAVSLDETPDHLQLSRESSPHETPTANNRDQFHFSDSLQLSSSYSRHRRTASRDTTKLSQSLVATPRAITLSSKRPYSRNHSTVVKEPDDLVSETASKCVLFLIDKLGPRVTAKNIVTGLLAQTVHCFETAKTPDLVHIGNLERIFRCLSEVILVYGPEIISCQLIPFFFNQMSDISSPLTTRALSGIFAALHILKLCLALITDQFLMSKLLSFIQCLTHSANLFMSPSLHLLHGEISRQMLANIWIRITVEICERIGRDMIILHFTRLIFSFFVNAERFHSRFSQDTTTSMVTSISPLVLGSAASPGALSDDFYTDVSLEGTNTVYGPPKRLSSILNTQLDSKLSCPELHTYRGLSSETSEEFELCFGPVSLLSMYNPICRVLGNVYMDSHMSRYPFSKALIEQQHVEENSEDETTSEASSTEDLDDDLSLAELDSRPPMDSAPSYDFGPSEQTQTFYLEKSFSWVSHSEDDIVDRVEGNRLRSSTVLMDDPSQLAVYPEQVAPTDRHLSAEWCYYWKMSIHDTDQDPFRFNGLKLESFDGHQGTVRGVQLLNSSENSFLSYGKDHTVKIWNITNQRKGGASSPSKARSASFTYHLHKRSINGIFFSPYLQKIVSSDGNIHIWDPWTGSQSRFVDLGTAAKQSPASNICEAGSRAMAVAKLDCSVTLFDQRSPLEQCCFFKIPVFNSFVIKSIAAARDGTWIAVGLSNGSLVIIDIRTGMTPAAWKLYDCEITEIKTFGNSPGPFLMTHSADGKIGLWNFENEDSSKLVVNFNKIPEALNHFEIFQQTQLLGISTTNKLVLYDKIFSPSNSFLSAVSKTFGCSCFCIGPFLMTHSANGKIGLWNFENEDSSKLVVNFNKIPEALNHFEIFQQTQLLGISTTNKLVLYDKIFSPSNSQPQQSHLKCVKLPSDVIGSGTGGNVTSFAALPINRQILMGTESGSIKLAA